jgi:uncharacterized protein (TIGR03118 family)
MRTRLLDLRKWFRTRRPAGRKAPSARLTLEPLENRCVLSGNAAGTVLQTNLVSDLPGVAQHMDPNLVNPWGIAESPSTPSRPGSPFWVSDNNAGVSTLYNSTGVPQTLVVSIPAPGDPLGASGTPTGTVFNIDLAGGGFMVSGFNAQGVATSAPAVFLFATEDGTIVGWNPGVNPKGFDPNKAGTYGIIAVDNSSNPTADNGAVYKGLTIASSSTPIFASDPSSTTVIYAANFRSGQIEVYDPNFTAIKLPKGAFNDPNLPKGYAPFDVQVLGGKVYVTYALQDADKHDDVAGKGHGFVDVFNLDGTPGLPHGKERLVTRGDLNSPWGLAIAPASFGSFGGDLLVGNFGNGRINVYDPTTGKDLGFLKDPDGEPIQIDGLWALKVGNDGNGGNSNTVYFTAGLDHEHHGLFGSLAPVAPGTDEGLAEEQKVQAALDVFQIDLNTVQQDLANHVPQAQLQMDLQTLNTDFLALVQAEIEFARDSREDMGAGHHHGHDMDDALSDLFADLGKLL